MSGLILKLSPHERVLINGAVIENGDRRGRIRILTENASILRLKDAFHPDSLDTPVKHICYTIQLALSGDLCPNSVKVKSRKGIAALQRVFQDEHSARLLRAASEQIEAERFYKALKTLRELLNIEANLMALG